jgi:aubergine
VYTVVHPIDGSEVEVTIIFKRERLLNECIHLYNVLLKRIMTELQLARLGRHHYDPKGAKLIPQHK